MRHLVARVRGAAAASAVVAALDDRAGAVSAFDTAPEEWRVEAYAKSSILSPDLWARLALAAAACGGELVEIAEQRLPDRDWLAENQLAFPPLRIGRFFVYGSHFEGKAPAGAIGIALDAATAFGTGEHPSTQGCLLALEYLARRCRIAAPLDIGAGTAILSIAAAKLLRRPVRASDIDPAAVAVAQRNVERNGLAGLVRVGHAPGYRGRGLRRRRHDLVLSNILARPLALLAADLARTLAPGGRAVLSGLLRRQEPIVLAPHRGLGITLERRIVIDGWSSLIVRAAARPGAAMGATAPIYRSGSKSGSGQWGSGQGPVRRLSANRRPMAAAKLPAALIGPPPDRLPGSRGSPSGGCRYRPARGRRAPSARHRRVVGGANRKGPFRQR
ncbi:MAG: 50S ribosomal protein L11 methyltransferase [Stellaceae bacterium]